MKPGLLCLVFLVGLILTACMIPGVFAQTVFAPTGAKWYFHGESSPTAGAGTRYCLSEVEKDTVLLGTTCTKVITTCYDCHLDVEPHPYIDTFTQDPFYTYTSGDTVFYFNNEFVRFLPLYIFNVAPGDTIAYHIPTAAHSSPDTLFRVIVDSITMFQINGESLRRVWTTYLDDFWFRGSYTERLGAVSGAGLMGHEYITSVLGPRGLRCYSDMLINYQHNAAVPCNYLPTGIANPPDLLKNISVYPNPAVEILYFAFPAGNVTVKLIDFNGRILEEQFIGGSLTTTFSLQNYSSGVYLYQIITQDGVYTGKVMIDK